MVVRIQSTANPKSQFEFVLRDTEGSKFNQNLNLNLYREIQNEFVFLDLDQLAEISKPWRISIRISMSIANLIFSGT